MVADGSYYHKAPAFQDGKAGLWFKAPSAAVSFARHTNAA
jgi:hypothetical protein